MLTLITWLRQSLLGFPTIRLLFPPFPDCTLWKEVICSVTLRNREFSSTSLKVFVYINSLEFLQGIFVCSPIYLFNQFISVWIHRYLFYTLCYDLTLLPYFVTQIFCFGHWELSKLCPLGLPASLCVAFFNPLPFTFWH